MENRYRSRIFVMCIGLYAYCTGYSCTYIPTDEMMIACILSPACRCQCTHCMRASGHFDFLLNILIFCSASLAWYWAVSFVSVNHLGYVLMLADCIGACVWGLQTCAHACAKALCIRMVDDSVQPLGSTNTLHVTNRTRTVWTLNGNHRTAISGPYWDH